MISVAMSGLILDDTQAFLESQGGDDVILSIDGLSNQLKQSYSEARALSISDEYKKVENVVFCGMGGSRFPAFVVYHLFKKLLKIPVVVNDDYRVPGFVNNKSLVILSSYSGATEEVLFCGDAAKNLGAKLVGIGSGGEVADFLKAQSSPSYVFSPVHNPSGQPRIGFGYSVGGLIGILMNLSLIDIDDGEITSAIDNTKNLLDDFRTDSPKEKNPAKQLAERLFEKYPYYIVSEFTAGVGNAIANQTNETAKSISSFHVIPELNHHLMEGLKHPGAFKNLAVFIFFYSSFYSARIKKRFHITKDVVSKNGIAAVWHELKGASMIEQVFELMGFGSYLSMYLSFLYRENPTAIPYVDYFKKKLQEA